MHFVKTYKMSLKLLAILLFAVLSSFLNEKTRMVNDIDLGGWVKLGTVKVSPGVYQDKLEIAESTESFNRLKLKVSKSSVSIRNIYVIYNDNTSEGLRITHYFKKGESSRILDLIGYQRHIKTIIFNYGNVNSDKGKAQIVVFAKQ